MSLVSFGLQMFYQGSGSKGCIQTVDLSTMVEDTDGLKALNICMTGGYRGHSYSCLDCLCHLVRFSSAR